MNAPATNSASRPDSGWVRTSGCTTGGNSTRTFSARSSPARARNASTITGLTVCTTDNRRHNACIGGDSASRAA